MHYNIFSVYSEAVERLHGYLAERFSGKAADNAALRASRDDFISAYIFYSSWNEHHGLPQRDVLLSYAFVCTLLEHGQEGVRGYFNEKWIDSGIDLHLQRDIADAVPDVAVFSESLSGVDFLTLYVALTKNIRVTFCEGSQFMPMGLREITPDECIIRYIHDACREDSALAKCMGGFLWDHITLRMVRERPMLYWEGFSQAMDVPDKREKLREIIKVFAEGSMNDVVFRYFALAYKHYDRMRADAEGRDEAFLELMEKRWTDVKSYQLYGEQESFLSEEDVLHGMLRKANFSRYEVDWMREKAKEEPFCAQVLHHLYAMDFRATVNGRIALRFTFSAYPQAVYGEYYQMNADTENYFWLPALPESITYAHLGEQIFCDVSALKPVMPQAGLAPLRSDALFGQLGKAQAGIYLYTYAFDLMDADLPEDLLDGNEVFLRFAREYQSIPGTVARRAALRIAEKFSGDKRLHPLMDQLIYTEPALREELLRDWYRSMSAQQVFFLAAQLPTSEDFFANADRKYLAALLYAENSQEYRFVEALARGLERDLLQEAEPSREIVLYLAYAYTYFDFISEASEKVISRIVRRGLDFIEEHPARDDLSEIVYAYLRSSLEHFVIDSTFVRTCRRLWRMHQSMEDKARGLTFYSFACEVLAAGDHPLLLEMSDIFEDFARADYPRHTLSYEFMLYARYQKNQSVSEAELKNLRELYLAQKIMTTRTQFMLQKCFPDDAELFRLSMEYEWVSLPQGAEEISVEKGSYAQAKAARPISEFGGSGARMLHVGYDYVFLLHYTLDGEEQSVPVKRSYSQQSWKMQNIYAIAKKSVESGDLKNDILLLAGRASMDSGRFEPESFLGYLYLLSGKSELHAEMIGALRYAWEYRNALTKYYMTEPDKAGLVPHMYCLYLENAALLEKEIPLSAIFSQMYFLDRVAGRKSSLTKAVIHYAVQMHMPEVPQLEDMYARREALFTSA